jgi:hypothetical protein
MTLEELKKLSGVIGQGVYANTPKHTEYTGMNMSVTGNEKEQLMKKHNIEPGTPEWFKLWFSLPYLTGEKPVK